MGNKGISSLDTVSEPIAQELTLTSSFVDDSWAEAIEMCLAHLEVKRPGKGHEPPVTTVSLPLTPENLAPSEVETVVEEFAANAPATAEAETMPPVDQPETELAVAETAPHDEPAASVTNDDTTATITEFEDSPDAGTTAAETIAEVDAQTPGEEPNDDISVTQAMVEGETAAPALSETEDEFDAISDAISEVEEKDDVTAYLTPEAGAAAETVTDEVVALETDDTETVTEVNEAVNEPDATSVSVTAWPKLEDLNLDEFDFTIEEEPPAQPPIPSVNADNKAIEAFASPARPSEHESAAMRGAGPAIAELVATRAEVRRLETRCANLEQLHHEASKTLARRQADFDNHRRRTEREREELRPLIVGEVTKPLFPVVDNLLRALAAQSADPQHFVQGVELIAQQLDTVMAEIGIQIVPSVGQPFNPEVHEAVALETTDEFPPHTVTLEILRGYQLGQRLLRPAMVKVAAQTSVSSPAGES